MTRFKLENRMKDFAQYLGIDIKRAFYTDYQLDRLYEHTKRIDDHIFDSAIFVLESNYNPGRIKRMPYIEEILDAIKKAQSGGEGGLVAELPDGCSKCNMTGFVYVDGQLFRFCECARGRKYETNFKKHRRKND